MIVFTLTLLICSSASDCRWITAAHFLRESLCHELGKEYLLGEPTAYHYKCTAAVRE